MKAQIKITESVTSRLQTVQEMKDRIEQLKEELKACQEVYVQYSNSN